MFTSNKLKQVVGVDRFGSFSAAAEALNISQSTLTKAVADVEQDLGFTLFLRTARGVIATPEGREFLARAERIVADFDVLIEDAKSRKIDADAFLRLGIAPASQEGLYNRVIAGLLRDSPEICLTVIALPVERGVHLLKQGDLDLLLAPMDSLTRERDFVAERVARLSVQLFCRKGHPVLRQDSIGFDDIAQYKIVAPDLYSRYANRLAELLSAGNFEPRRRLHVIENFSVVATVIAQSDLFGIVSESYARTRAFKNRFALLDLEIFDPIALGAARLARWTLSRSVRSCLAALRNHPLEAES